MEELQKALAYVRSQFDDSDKDILNYVVRKAMAEHVPARLKSPSLAGQVLDALDDYSRDHDLPEDWWLEYGDIDEIIEML